MFARFKGLEFEKHGTVFWHAFQVETTLLFLKIICVVAGRYLELVHDEDMASILPIRGSSKRSETRQGTRNTVYSLAGSPKAAEISALKPFVQASK